MKKYLGILITITLLNLTLTAPSMAEEVRVAVAANFTAPMKVIAANFEKASGNKVTLSFGATGMFYTQIKNGAPFDILLSADMQAPEKLEQEGAAVPGVRFTYAIGKLVLWSLTPSYVDDKGDVLKRNGFKHVALASPKVAPYGAAAMEVMEKLDLVQSLQSKFVQGENIAQAYLFASTGNAELGFVALSQVTEGGKLKSGSVWMIPQTLYTPLRQDAALLTRAKDNTAAKALIEYLKSESALVVIRSYGYEL